MNFRQQIVALMPMLRRYALSITSRNHSLADDLVQNTMLKALANQDKFAAGTNLEAWLCTILRNDFLSIIRKRRREVEDPDSSYAASLPVKSSQDDHMQLDAVEEVIASLSRREQYIVNMMSAGASYEEVAKQLAIPLGTIKSRLHRVRARLSQVTGMAA